MMSWPRCLEPDRTTGGEVRLQCARRHHPGRPPHLRLVLSVVRSWKNSLSATRPTGEEGLRAVPRAQIAAGKSIELLAPSATANRDGRRSAFAALMRHVKAVDGREHTVIMIQVQNEVGMHGDSRDRSPRPIGLSPGPVPKELMDYLQQHRIP